MFNYFRQRKKLKALSKFINLWYNACMMDIKEEKLFDPRPKVGAVCFFIGSIDSLCQSLQLDDRKFISISLNFFRDKHFYKFDQIAPAILDNYFLRNQRIKFATDAMKIGMDSFKDWYNSSFLSTIQLETFSYLISEWNRKPNLEGEELFILIKNK